MIKNEAWWEIKEKPLTLEKIIINLYSSIGELYNSFKIGNLDVVATDNTNLTEYIGTIGYTPKELKGRNHTFLAFNTQNQLLARSEVRQAIAYSIDKNNITSSVFNNQVISSDFPLDYGSWLCQDVDTSVGYNTEQAKQILEQAGWTYTRSRTWQKTENRKTQRIELNLLVKASDSGRVAVAENIKAQLENQGIRINILQANDDEYNTRINNKDYDIAICTLTLSTTPDLTTFFGGGNLANYTNEEINNIMQEVKNTTDENVLKERYSRLIEIYRTEIPYLSLYNNKYVVAYNSGLVGDLTPNWFSSFYGVEGWYK